MKKIYKLVIVPHTPRETIYGPKETLAFCVKMIVFINEGSAVDVVYFSQQCFWHSHSIHEHTFDHSILGVKPKRAGLDGWPARWAENWLITGLEVLWSSGKSLTCNWLPMLWPILLNNFMNYSVCGGEKTDMESDQYAGGWTAIQRPWQTAKMDCQ